MAFVSLNEMRVTTPSKAPSVTFRANGVGYITKAIYRDKKPSTIEVQIDISEKKVRLKTGDNFLQKLNGRVGHTFSLPKAAAKEVIPPAESSIKIILTEGEDGWWYGEYGNSTSAED
ncbi:hypothetical protein [Cronobacter turicensis]|uniref:hypothetical protein n=1 Tax=Cronobacter turicensis TaxID=413502 RepID=UPI0011AC3185|nr:hypothetical protein [Cronobacter turicensis]TWR31814.1 hypothetical protein FQY85_20695 [Cronobacter turicensis]